MLQRKSQSAPKPASADKVVTRALQLVDPKPEQTEEARTQVVDAIATIKRVGEHMPGPETTKRELRELASALRRAIAAVERPSPWGTWALGAAPRLTAVRLRSLCGEFAAIAEAAEWLQARLVVRKGPQVSGKRWVAALEADRLLRTYRVEPTLSAEGAFFQLAATLYEGATGIADADLSRACRRYFHACRSATPLSPPSAGDDE
jgi:hypothetical protein